MEVTIMPDVILAVLGRENTAQETLEAARHLATLIGRANVIALAVDMPPFADPLAAEALIAEAADAAELHEQDRKRTTALAALFEAWAPGARQAGIAVEWRKGGGAAHAVVEQIGRRADFIVIAQPATDDDALTSSGFRAALLRSERPVLVIPRGQTATFGRNVAIAWRDDGRVVKAVIPVLRLLSSAAEVHVLQGTRGGEQRLPVPAMFQDHAIDVRMHVLPIAGVFGQILLERAHALGADMLVMGAYAHNPLREMMFGGVTRYMLDHADLPVLMRH
jgi:nucleotide-binding universal stress UspA family protein